MKQVAQNYRTGELAVLDVQPPACKPGGVLVRSLYSLISTGTELMKFSEAKMSLIGKARARPDQVKKVLDSVAQQGPVTTYQKVMNRLDSYTPLGYSLCGIVIEVGAGAEEFHVGQLVAAAGNEFALHADVNWIPLNLCVAVPDGVRPEHAAFSTVGAIAMQGVRQAEPQLGEVACVIGLGLVGQLAVRLLVAAGVRVFGLDPVAARCGLAEKAGALACASPDAAGVAQIERAIADRTGVIGADHVLLASGGPSNQPVETAARLARDRGRVVDIGKCSLDLPWNAYYEKELDVRFSRSYGPGRYDEGYELRGTDYPIGYVRWTERRNLGCFVDLLGSEQLDLDPLVSGLFPVTDAVQVYEKMKSGELHGVGFLFEYPGAEDAARAGRDQPSVRPAGTSPRRPVKDRVDVGFIGVGNYASSVLLPALIGLDDIRLATVVTTRSLSAYNAQRRFHFDSATTSVDDILDDPAIHAVFIATRHHSHAELTCRALERGKSVFVEKPLALTVEQLDMILRTVEETGNDRVMVGFNRRFSPMLGTLRERFGTAHGPVSAKYLVNAGPMPADSWYRNEELEGSRFVGEGGHFIDTLSWWIGARPTRVQAMTGPDRSDLHVGLRFEDGSVATLTYDTGGHVRLPKETFEVSAGGYSARLDNFTRASVWKGRKRRTETSRRIDKGQAEQLACFVSAVRTGGPMPIALDSLVATTAATLAAQRSAVTGQPEPV